MAKDPLPIPAGANRPSVARAPEASPTRPQGGDAPFTVAPPKLELPKGGGALRGIGEKFAANPATGTGALTVPIATSPGRAGFGPQLALSYDSGSGNGLFGFGWTLALPHVTRKTDKGLPQYDDAAESDVFLLSGAEDLVPVLRDDLSRFEDQTTAPGYVIHRYRPRIEGPFARIERWTRVGDGDMHWCSLSRDNVLSVYGRNAASRIADPANTRRVHTWLLCETRDDKGNAVVYDHKPEDAAGVDLTLARERNRGLRDDPRRQVNRHIKRIRYGNKLPLLDADGQRTHLLSQDELDSAGWMFEVVFDYGEHALAAASTAEGTPWALRADEFSSCRAGFEVRTSRRCRRVLMFHHFESEPGVGNDCLVRSTDFTYADELTPPDPRSPIHSFIRSVTRAGYRRTGEGYLKRELPPVEFEYSMPIVQTTVQEVDAASLENLPVGLDGSAYRWTDLHGEGIPGLLTEQAGAWHYKRNLSPLGEAGVAFAPLERVATRPNAGLNGGGAQFMDLAGDGRPDLVVLDGPTPGFHEHDEGEGWGPFRPFAARLNRDMRDPNLRLVDLDGDGHADVLITEDDAFIWHASLAEEGFGPARRVQRALDEETGPRLVFADVAQSIHLADMNGDGLTDLVRVRNGEVCYWPNLGHGRFGAKLTMDHAPLFDRPDRYDQGRIRLADIDGSGAADLVYLSGDGVTLYFNQSGNAWSAGQKLAAFPAVDNLAAIQLADLMGNGTACLVWSSPLPGHGGRAMRYVDLMGGQKPHLLVRSANNMGTETTLHYAPSTKFYLADKRAGQPWVTKLPFPVHVVERVETMDRISGNRFVTRYAYHHGHFDGVEREFRGFGMVEQWDTEEIPVLGAAVPAPNGSNFDAASHVPPVLTRTWFHTGRYLGREKISNYFAGLTDDQDAGEYYREPGLSDAEASARLLEDTVLPAGLSSAEEREACRALKGAMLRTETYALDGSDREPHPCTVAEQNFTIRLLQPQAGNRHAVFLSHAREALTCQYERNPADPRVAHALTLEVDAYGDVLRAAAVAYGRRQPDTTLTLADQARQAERHITCNENTFTNAVDLPGACRTPLPSESRSYELSPLPLLAGRVRYSFDEVLAAASGATPIDYETGFDSGVLQKRLIEHTRTTYRPNDLGASRGDALALLPLGTVESMAVPGESYRLALTPGMVSQAFGDRVSDEMLVTEAAYVHSQGDSHWWLRSGRTFLSPDAADSAASEWAQARQHFFLPRRYRDPFHRSGFETESVVSFDPYDLAVGQATDALGNTVSAVHDYRVHLARLTTDPNGNRAEVAFDALGRVVGTAAMGKLSESLGDTLDGFVPDLDEATQLAHLADPLADPHAVLQHATTRIVVDQFAYLRTRDLAQPQPAVAYVMARETHDADLGVGEQTRIQHAFSYSDGFGREMQKKLQAEPGPLAPGGAVLSPRWVGNGWTVFNNKGKPVRQYEPFFSSTHAFEFERTQGVSPVLCYDPAGRVVATLYPNHSWEKRVFDPWRQEAWDVNDTVLVADPRLDPDVGAHFARLPEPEVLPTWFAQRIDGSLGKWQKQAAAKAAVHAATPAVTHLDSLGRAFMVVAHTRWKYSNTQASDPPQEAFHRTRTVFDIEGNTLEVIDALDRIVMRYEHDMLGQRIHTASMDAGERWMLGDVAGRPVCAWDSRGHRLRTTYDALGRPAETHLQTAEGAEQSVNRMVYGEGLTDAVALNLRGKPHQVFDGAGVATTEACDFKGNVLVATRRLAVDYKKTLDWSAEVALETEVFTSRTAFDALNRPVAQTTPDNSTVRRTYNEAGLLETVEANLRGEAANGQAVWTPFVTRIDYSAKGQREQISYGNSAVTSYTYDPLTFRLTRLHTRAGGKRVQDLNYSHDPIGNITRIEDAAQQTIYFRNARVEPSNDYLYSATYELIEAAGREHLGQLGGTLKPPTAPDAFNGFHTGLLHPGDGHAMGRYLERYVYDAAGNFLEMQHSGSDPATPGWTRVYAYNEASAIETGQVSNRLSSTRVGQGPVEPYSYDAHGSMTAMPHLALMEWNERDQLQASAQQASNAGTPETTFYVYDAAGQRVRKVTEGNGRARTTQRMYLGEVEIYSEYESDGVVTSLARETLHVMDDRQRIAMVETRTQGDDGTAAQLVRCQLAGHLGSSCVELDSGGRVMSYEEYFPYGSTSYQAMDPGIKAAAKRYRYTGMERDDETGLTRHGARYCASWLARWTSADPSGIADGPNAYRYAGNRPSVSLDSKGMEEEEWSTISQLAVRELGWGTIYEAVQTWPEDTIGERAAKSAMTGIASLGTGADYLITVASHPQVAAYEATISIPFNAGIRASRLASEAGASPGDAALTGLKTTAWGTAMNVSQPARTVVSAAMLGPNMAELAHHIVYGEPQPLGLSLGLAAPTLEAQTNNTLISAVSTVDVASQAVAFTSFARPRGLQYALAGNTIGETTAGAVVYRPLPGRAYLMLENTSAASGFHRRLAVRVGSGEAPYAGMSFGMDPTPNVNPFTHNFSAGGLNGRPIPGGLGNGGVYADVIGPSTQTVSAFRLRGAEYALVQDYMATRFGERAPYNALTNSCRNFSATEFEQVKAMVIQGRQGN